MDYKASFNGQKVYLAHHGIKGMKWGVRRFRNTDGSLTAAGKRRYAEGGSGHKTRNDISVAIRRRQDTERSKPTERLKGMERTEAKKPTERIGHRTHRDKLVEKYREKGMSQKEAEKAANKRITFEKSAAIGAGIVAASVAAYAGYKYVQKNKLDINLDLDSQLKRKSFESTDFDKAIDDDLRKINRGGLIGHDFLAGRHNNCTSCSMAYEMRRRGYDVVAGKSKNGRTNETVETFFKNARFENAYSTFDTTNPFNFLMRGPMPKPSSEQIDSTVALLLSQGEGARGMIHGHYYCGGGHSIAWEVHNGKVHFVDGQLGRQYKDAKEAIGLMSDVDWLRTDNLELANTAAETVMNNNAAAWMQELPSQAVVETTAETAITGYYIYNRYLRKPKDKKSSKDNKDKKKGGKNDSK